MNINRSNYESWFLDYHEGTLTPGQAEELFAFLDAHADLREEFEAFEMIRLDKEDTPVQFDKSLLHRQTVVDNGNLDEWLISEMEGRLSEEELNLLHDYLHQHPEEKTRRTLFAATRLEAGDEKNPSGRLLYAMEPIGAHNIDLWLIAGMEGELHLQQRVQLQEFLSKNPSYLRHRELYAATRLTEVSPVTYTDKASLYKKETPVVPLVPVKGGVSGAQNYRTLLRIAAILLLLIGAYLGLQLYLQPTSGEQHIASDIQPEVITPENRLPDATTENPEEKAATVNQEAAPSVSTVNTPGTLTPSRKKSTTPVLRRRYNREQQLAQSTPVKTATDPMPLKGNPHLYTEEPFVFAERRYTPKATPQYNAADEPPSLRNIIHLQALEENISAEINQAAGEEIILNSKTPEKLTLGSKIIRFAAKAVGKLSGEKVKVRTVFNPVTGKLSAYEVLTKNKSWAKQF